MSGLTKLAGQTEPCEQHSNCLNWALSDAANSACGGCKFGLHFPGVYNLWRPMNGAPKKHPVETAAKKEAKRERDTTKFAARRNRDRGKREIQRQAAAAERRTERSIISATLNSGRVHKDGDHSMASGLITLDTKNQSGNENPVVHMVELAKVKMDSTHAGRSYSGLVLRNKHGVGVVVMYEEDFAQLVRGLDL